MKHTLITLLLLAAMPRLAAAVTPPSLLSSQPPQPGMGSAAAVVAPNLIKTQMLDHGQLTDVWIEPAYVEYGSLRHQKCDESALAEAYCERLSDMLNDKDLAIEFVGAPLVDGKPIYRAHIYQGTTSLSRQLVDKGIYPVDARQSPPAAWYWAERQAKCRRLGRWASLMGDAEMDMHCQEFADDGD